MTRVSCLYVTRSHFSAYAVSCVCMSQGVMSLYKCLYDSRVMFVGHEESFFCIRGVLCL